jgi:PKD repeat protein
MNMKKLLSLTIGLMIAAITASAQTCEFTAVFSPNGDGNVTLTAPAGLSPNEFTFFWMFSSGLNSQSGYSINATYSQTTIDNVTLLVISTGPDSNIVCNSTQTINVLVDNQNASCPIEYSNSPGSLSNWTFTTPGANYTPNWSFGDGTTASGLTVDHIFANPGTYEVCMNITGGGFTCDNCVIVTVPGDTTITPSECSADFYASTSALVGFYIPTGNTSANDTYSWDFGDGSTSSEIYPYHQYEVSGTYNVCLLVTSENCFQNICQEVFIPESNVIPNDTSCYAGFVISQDNPFEVSVVNTTSGNDLTFNWTISSGLISITASGAYPSMTIESTGSYVLCLTVANANGCTATFCDSIIVGDNGLIGGRLSAAGFVINVQSPATITGYSVLGMEQSANNAFQVFPNPFNDNIMISTDSEENRRFEIVSIDGKLVQSGQINNQLNTISTSELGAGIYMLNVIDNNGRKFVQKIVKQ